MKTSDKNIEKQSLTVSIDDLAPFLSTQLYSNPQVFLRELVCNSYDAIKRREQLSNTKINGFIEISCDNGSTVRIQDNGIGMSKNDLIEYLSCIGKSATRKVGPTNKSVIGQFGLGFLSVMAVAKKITVETRYFDHTIDNNAHQWLWQEGTTFKLFPGKLDQVGTIVKIDLKDEFSIYATPSQISKLVQKHVPFLDVEVSVQSNGDPRQRDLPWLTNKAPVLKKIWREDFDTSVFAEWIDQPLYSFAAALSGGTGVFAFPRGNKLFNHRIGCCQHGVLVQENLLNLMPINWDWISGVVDLRDNSLTLDRGHLKMDQKFQKTKADIHRILSDELVHLCFNNYETFKIIVKEHRDRITNILLSDQKLRQEIGEKYTFETTLGELGFAEIARMADWNDGQGSLQFINVPPNTESRWATYRIMNKMLVWCQNKPEESLLEKLASDRKVRLDQVTQISSLKGAVGQLAPLVSAEMERWLGDLRDYLKNDGIHIEPSRFASESILSVLENTSSNPSLTKRGTVPQNDNIFTQFFRALSSGLETEICATGRLYLNTINPTIQAMANQDKFSYPLELAAALLITNGAVQSGVPLEIHWQNVLAKLTDAGIRALKKGPQIDQTAPHVICFFAHQFDVDKPILDALRKTLEHEPYFWEVVSGEEKTEDPELYENVWKQLIQSHIFIGEVTRNNPNVLFETGVASALKEKDKILLLLEKGAQITGNLRGRLYYEYDSKELTAHSIFDKKFRAWINNQNALHRFKRLQPFLGYRLLAEQNILNSQQCTFLEHEIGESMAFLAETPERVSALTRISKRQLDKAQSYFRQRIDRYNQRII